MTDRSLRICPLCEACCGLALDVEGGRVTSIRGDDDDVFSRGFLCPKAPRSANCTPIPIGCAPRS